MRLIHLVCYFLLTTLCQVLYAIQTCGCGTQSCTNIQVGYHTYIPENCDDQSPMSESSCYNKLTLPNVWIVNYRPDNQACRISECDTTPGMKRSIYGMIMYRKTCQTGCLNYTLEKYTSCWTQPSSPAVLAQQYSTSSEEECLRSCLPPIKSCIVVYDSSSDECEVFENVDTSASPPCIQTGWSQMTYYVSCYDIHLCEIPAAISFGSVSYTDRSVSSTATYYCEIGYELIGTATVTCQVDLQWSTPLPYCQIVDCNAPPTVAYAVVSPADPLAISLSTVYGSTVSYSCEAGYNLSGAPTISCLDSGAWESPLPSCQIVDCNTPPTVPYAEVSPADPLATSLSTVYGSSVTYSCEAGYTLSGSPNVSCLDSGAWESPLPSCQIVDCNGPPTVTYAVVSPSDPLASSLSTVYGSSVTYSCEAGYTLSGSPNVSCLDSGAWESPLPSCQIVDCNGPPTVTYAVVSPSDPLASSLSTVYGSSVTYSCEAGYTLSGSPNVSCLDSGAWESPLPSCQIVDCNGPPTVTYAVVSPSDPLASSLSTVYGSSVTYSCEAGYTLSSSPNVSCLDSGAWESPLPSCQIMDCNDPPNVTHATVVAMTTTYNSTATYTCAAQYTIVGTATVSCLDDGQWGPSIPSCSLVDCQAPLNVTNATVSFTGTTSGSYATYTCFTSHTQVGPPTIACQGDGSWTQPMVLCVPIGNAANTPPRPLYITSCACSTGSSFINMTEDEIIAKLIADTEINSKETTLSQYSLKCRPDNRTSSLITGIVGIAVLSIVFGTMLCLDLLTLCRYFKRNGAK